MSVLKSQRGESTVQFLDTARELEIYTIKTCAKFPKRYMFLITKDIVALASAVYNNAKAANSIYVTTADDARLRREYVTKANCTLQCLLSQIDIAHEFVKTTDANLAELPRQIAALESSVKSAHHRIDGLERNINQS